MATEINILHEFLSDLVGDHKQFRPTRHFFEGTGINAYRFGKLYRGQHSPTFKEMKAISDYFGAPLQIMTSKRQFKLELD